MLERVSDAFIFVNRDWRIVYANRRAAELNHKPREAFIGRLHWEEWPAALGTELERQFRAVMEQGVEAHFEHRYVSPPYDVWMEVDAYPAADGISLFYRDITARKLAEETARRNQEDLMLAVDAARLGTFSCGWPIDKITWNSTCKEHFFLPPDADVDVSVFYALLHPDDREPTRRAIEHAMTQHSTYDIEYRTVAPDGRMRWIHAVGLFRYDSEGRPVRFDGVTADVGARKAAEDELRSAAQRQRFLAQLGERTHRRSSPEEIIADVVRSVGHFLGVSRCAFADIDIEADTCTIWPDFRSDDSLASMEGRVPISAFGEPLILELKSGRSMAVDDVRIDSRQVPPENIATFEINGIRAFAVAPVVHSTRLVSCLACHNATARRWTAAEIELLQIVVERTWLTVEVLRQRQREQTVAQQLQDALKPQIPARIPGLELGCFTRPALEEAQVGGDFYDVFPLDDGRWALVIGDISGKGLAAAQEIALVRNYLRMMLYVLPEPAQAAATVNRVLTARELLAGFVTVWVGLYQPETGEIVYCSCGHEPGLLRCADGAVEALHAFAPPLGVRAESLYADRHLRLERGDALLLYTDGMSEAGPNRDELLTTEGLLRLLSAVPPELDAQRRAEALVQEARAYAGGAFDDDVAVLVLLRLS